MMLATVTAAVRAICPAEIPPSSDKQHEDRQPGGEHHQHVQQAGQQFAQHEFLVRQVRQQQQDEGPPVLLLGHRAGGQHGREEDGQGQLQRGEDLEDQPGELRQVAHVADDLRAGEHQPGRADQQQQGRRIGAAGDVDPRPPRGDDDFASKNGTEKQPESPWSRGWSGPARIIQLACVGVVQA